MFKKRIEEVRTFFKENDVELGFRRLLDCVLDTQDMSIYNGAVQLTDWKYSESYSLEEFKTKANLLLDDTEKVVVVPSERSVIVSAADVVKTYNKHNFTLGPVSVDISKGNIFGLVGENGNGKTTLLRVLANELDYSSGKVSYNFIDNLDADYDLRTKLVYIPQRTQKWYGSLQDNLMFVLSNYGVDPEEIETRMLIMIARFGLWEYKDLKWSELSSGYKMRFELVRTMLRQPEVLLLDEPLANLDVVAQQIILEDLKSIANSINNPIAIILSSQQLYEVEKVSNKIIFLKKGKQTRKEEDIQRVEELVIELEANCSKEELMNSFIGLSLKNISFNGGVYFAYFDLSTGFNDVMQALINADIELVCLRNISSSTRRFFVN